MRRPVKHKTLVEPDTKYSSLLVAKFINKIMYSGKKAIAMKIVYRALERAQMELKSRRIGGANYQVPIEVKPERKTTLAIRWIVASVRGQKGKATEEKL